MRAFAEKPNSSQSSPSYSLPPSRTRQQNRDTGSLLDMQRTIGNRAVQRLMRSGHLQAASSSSGPTQLSGNDRTAEGSLLANSAANHSDDLDDRSPLPGVKSEFHSSTTSFAPSRAAGDQPGEAEGFALGGTPDAGVADAGPAADAGTTPDAGATASTAATSISTADLSAADWQNNGFFKWWIKWITDGKSGWIVQRIENTYSGTRADGTAITNASVGVTPSYYEAWEVASNGTITGSLGGTGNRDRWERPALGPLGSTLSLSMKGTVYWTATDPATSGFTSGGVTNAGSLLSSTSAPSGIGAPLLVRNAFGSYSADGPPQLPGCFTS